jgi:hypothetical protein
MEDKEKEYIENTTVDGNDMINWEEIIRRSFDNQDKKRPEFSTNQDDELLEEEEDKPKTK